MIRLLAIIVMLSSVQGAYVSPEQIHLSATGDASEMVVMWTTFYPTNQSTVQYGEHGANLTNTANGNMVKFVDGGSERTVRYMHTVKLTALKPASKYDYKVGSSDEWSKVFTMTSLNTGTNWSPRLAIYGDMGSTNAQSLSRLINEATSGNFDAILHIGDFAYDLATDNGKVGDTFMNNIQDVATQVPYMTAVGNHEFAYNFSHYINRFTMPGYNANYYYSWDVGTAHFIVFSTEVYFFLRDGGVDLAEYQYNWLEEDLKAAQSRTDKPWIITVGHRPMYCSTLDVDDCNHRDSVVRTGFPGNVLALEPLFYKYGVDIALWAHEHEYQRMWPVYNRTVYNGTDSNNPYENPGAPIHIITGSAGCKEGRTPFAKKMPWDAVRYNDYGYSHMNIINSTHVHWQQISDDKDGKVIDDIYIVRTKGHPSWL